MQFPLAIVSLVTARAAAHLFAAVIFAALLFGPLDQATVQAEEPAAKFSASDLEFFEKEVRPLLVKRCYKCHSGEEPKGSLSLESREALLTGGDSGPAIEPGKPDESLLIESVNYTGLYEMPPKSKLPAAELKTLTKWVKLGAPWPASDAGAGVVRKSFDLESRKASHWAWQPLREPAVPEVRNAAWPADDIDRFILHKLEAAGLAPNGPAEKSVLLRRVTFAITGLPPTPAEIAAFVADESPDAYEKVVDRLLDSPTYGERWGRHWLDLVRYAESRGHEFDYDAPNAWQYRDYVIRALNEDVPYDQWVTEHLAGDLAEKPRTNPEMGFNESVLGTGFWHLGEWIHSPVDLRADEADRFDNMIDVFSKSFLGMTVSCARCHDHKFDAISQADYYALGSFLQSSSYRQSRFESEIPNGKVADELAEFDRLSQQELIAMAVNQRIDTAGKLAEYLLAGRDVFAEAKSENNDQLTAAAKIVAAKSKLNADVLTKWVLHLKSARDDANNPFALWGKLATKPAASAAELKEWVESHRNNNEIAAEPTIAADIIVDYDNRSTNGWLTDGYSFGLGPQLAGSFDWRQASQPIALRTDSAAVRDAAFNGLSITPGSANDVGRISKWNRPGRTLRTDVFELTSGVLQYRFKGNAQVWAVVDSHRLVQGPLHGTHIKTIKSGDKVVWGGHDLRRYIGHRMHLEFVAVGDDPFELFEVRDGAKPPQPTAAKPLQFLNLADDAVPTAENIAQQYEDEIVRAYAHWPKAINAGRPADGDLLPWVAHLANHPELWGADDDPLQTKAEELRANRAKIAAKVVKQSRLAPAMWDGFAENQPLLIRGNPKSPGDEIPRRTLTALGGDADPITTPRSGRLELAKRLLDWKQNPLTSRVAVNRIWHHLFGRGIAPSVDNFGVLGIEPTHPELLDHLAMRFIREGWSTKRLIKEIVLTRTYQMASEPGDAGAELDPTNKLLHHMPVRRLEAEAIRDSILAISGRLNPTMYGPSVPVFLTPFMQGRGKPGQGPLDGNGRRSIYISVRRNFLSPMMLAFDAPQPFSTVGKRNVSNVPAQALILMNDPFVIEQAKLWAQRELKQQASPAEHIQSLYMTAFGRPPSAAEIETGKAFLQNQSAEYNLPADNPLTDIRLWQDYCHVLMNVKEFIFIR